MLQIIRIFFLFRFPDQDPPRWYFKDCYSSFLLVFCMLCGDWKQPMVNTVLFTSCASDLLMLIFVLIGNFVVSIVYVLKLLIVALILLPTNTIIVPACCSNKFLIVYINPLMHFNWPVAKYGVFCQTDNRQIEWKLNAFSVPNRECKYVFSLHVQILNNIEDRSRNEFYSTHLL